MYPGYPFPTTSSPVLYYICIRNCCRQCTLRAAPAAWFTCPESHYIPAGRETRARKRRGVFSFFRFYVPNTYYIHNIHGIGVGHGITRREISDFCGIHKSVISHAYILFGHFGIGKEDERKSDFFNFFFFLPMGMCLLELVQTRFQNCSNESYSGWLNIIC